MLQGRQIAAPARIGSEKLASVVILPCQHGADDGDRKADQSGHDAEDAFIFLKHACASVSL